MLTRSILKSQSLRRLFCATATAGLLLPSASMAAPVVAATPAATTATAAVTDVAVVGDVIRGVLVDAAGQPVAGQTVTLATRRATVAQGLTDAAGRYEVAAAGGTHYTLTVAGESLVVRTWDAAIAPPAARESLTLVQPTQTVRGQSCTGCDGGCDGCCPPAGGCVGGGGISRGGVLLGGAALIGAGVIGAIALSNADDAEDAAGDASDKTTDNMMRLETQRQAINETNVRVNTIQNEIEDADDFDDLQDSLNDLDDLDLITQSPS